VSGFVYTPSVRDLTSVRDRFQIASVLHNKSSTARKTNKTKFIRSSRGAWHRTWHDWASAVPSLPHCCFVLCSLYYLFPILRYPTTQPPPLARCLPNFSAAPLGRDKTYTLPPDGDNTHNCALRIQYNHPTSHISFISVFHIDNFSPRVAQSNRQFKRIVRHVVYSLRPCGATSIDARADG
jgi:hypothetical protein